MGFWKCISEWKEKFWQKADIKEVEYEKSKWKIQSKTEIAEERENSLHNMQQSQEKFR